MPSYTYRCGRQTNLIIWNEPPNLTIRITEAEAITRQRSSALSTREFNYESDDRALDDFMTVHWAWREPAKPCGHEFETQQSITDQPLQVCPACQQPTLERLIGGTSFVLRGGGWARDGYGSNSRSKKSRSV